MRPRVDISTDARFDDQRWWSFERNSRIPYGSFGGRRWSRSSFGDVAVLIVAIVAIIIGLAVAS